MSNERAKSQQTSITLSSEVLARFKEAKRQEGLERLPNGDYLDRLLDERERRYAFEYHYDD